MTVSELTSSNGIRYRPVGFCIYCGANNCLTDEHVVPYGLGGNSLVLPKASCNSCAKITGQFENNFLRITSGQLREMLDAPTRGKSARTGRCELAVFERLTDGQLRPMNYSIVYPIDEAPIFYPAIVLPPPGILSNNTPGPGHDIAVRPLLMNKSASLSGISQDRRVYLGKFRPADTLRQLIKIAYGYAIGVLGATGFKPIVQELILGKSEEFLHVLGCFSEESPPDGKMVSLEQGYAEVGGNRYVVVKIRIYGQLPTPTYCVVVGEAV